MLKDVLETLFGDYKKVIAWSVFATLAVVVANLSSCVVKTSVSEDTATTEQIAVRGQTLITLTEQGHNPILVNCAVNGWRDSKNRTKVCLAAVTASGNLKELSREELESLLRNTRVITGEITE